MREFVATRASPDLYPSNACDGIAASKLAVAKFAGAIAVNFTSRQGDSNAV